MSDTVIITSRSPATANSATAVVDGSKHWRRTFQQAWLRPGTDRRNWSERSNSLAAGIRISATEWSMYVLSHYRWDSCHLQRLSIRPFGFASVQGGYQGGRFTTPPFHVELPRAWTFLRINYSTSAFGSVRVRVFDGAAPLQGALPLATSRAIYGDELNARLQWEGEAARQMKEGGTARRRWMELTQGAAGGAQPLLRFEFELVDADLFSWMLQPG